MLEKCKPKRK